MSVTPDAPVGGSAAAGTLDPASARPLGLTTGLTWLSGAAFAVLGIILFLAPVWSADHFPWKITPFQAMTEGGWYLGSVVAAWTIARLSWEGSAACAVYYWAFVTGQIAVLLAFRGAFHVSATLGWPYLIAFALGASATVGGIIDFVSARPALVSSEETPAWVRVLMVVFVLFVGFLAVVLLTGIAKGGSMWAKPLTPLTAHGFGEFYAALVVGMLILLVRGSSGATVAYAFLGVTLIVLGLIPAFVYHGVFDFQHRPAGVVYFLVYLVVGAGAVAYLVQNRPARNPGPASVGAGP